MRRKGSISGRRMGKAGRWWSGILVRGLKRLFVFNLLTTFVSRGEGLKQSTSAILENSEQMPHLSLLHLLQCAGILFHKNVSW